MKIGFYGDSFCNEINNPHNIYYRYDTYIKKIKNHYNAEITHLGIGGSSHWDVIIKQFSLDADLPDVCVFCWTDYARLYNTKVRDLTYNSVLSAKTKDWKFHKILHPLIHKSANMYFNHLYDDEKSRLEYLSALYYFNNCVLINVPSNIKIIHLWCFENFNHKWTYGLTVNASLNAVSNLPNELPKGDLGPNHFGDPNKNQIVFEWLKYAIDNYRSGSEINFAL
jgi:hypothetical protein